MQRVTWMRTVGIMIAWVVLLGPSQAMAAGTRPPGVPRYQMRGQITAIDITTNTVSIEVQQGPEQFTIRGPLSAKALVKQEGKAVPLSALRVGDQVQVQWERTATGHRITQLEASKQGYRLKSPLEHATHVLRSV